MTEMNWWPFRPTRVVRQCGLVNLNSYISGVGFYSCHLEPGHKGECALKPAPHVDKAPAPVDTGGNQ